MTPFSHFLLLVSLFSFGPPLAQAQITWTAADQIAPGAPVTAAGILEIKTAVEALRTDVDTGTGGLWTSGAGGDVYYNGGDVGIGVANPTQKLHVNGNALITGNVNATGTVYQGDGKNIIQYSDAWLRLNPSSNFTSGTYTPSNLMVAGNVGIGTTAPAAKLEVIANGENLRLSRNATQYTSLINNSSGAFVTSLSPTNNAKGLTLDSTNPSNAASTAGSNYVRVNVRGAEALRVVDGGNVGIGNTSPNVKLVVEGDIKVGGTNTWVFHSPDDGRRNLYFGTAPSSTAAIAWPINFNNDGNVTATKFTSSANAAGASILEYGGGTRALEQVSTRGALQLSSKDDAFYIGNGDVAKNINATYFNPEAENIGIASDGNIYFYSDLQEGWGTQNTMVYDNSGRLGIGIAPTDRLHVNGTARATAFIGNGAGLTALNASNITAGTLDLARIANNSIPAGKLAADSVAASEIAANAVGASEVANGSLVATTELSATGTKNSTTFLRGDNTWATIPSVNAILDYSPGNWEVASNSNLSVYSSAALEVREVNNGGAQTGALSESPRVAFHWGARAASQIGMDTSGDIRTFDNPGTGYEDFVAKDVTANASLVSNARNIILGNGDQRISGDNGGNLYVDSNSSTVSGLILRDKEDTIYGRVYGDGNGASFGFLDGDNQWGIRMTKDDYTSFNINNTERMRIVSNGNVGIGTSAPSARLHIEDGTDASLTSTGHALTVGQQASLNIAMDGNEIMARNNGAVSDLHMQTDGGNFYLRNNAAAGARFASLANGNVGIGTNSPSQKLDVAGSARINAGGNYSFINLGSGIYDQLYADNTAGGSFGGGLWFRITNSAGTGFSDSFRLAENGNVGIKRNPSASYSLDVAGTINADNLRGNGSAISALNASNITSGTLDLARIANNSITAGKLAANSVALSELSATGTANSSTFLRGDNTWATPPSGADNLGNHTATANLNMSNRAIVGSAGTVLDANGGWVRTYGNTGWYNGTHGGGFYMQDSTWLRNYNNKPLYMATAVVRTDGELQVGSSGSNFVAKPTGVIGVGLPSGTTNGVFASGPGIAMGDSNTGIKHMGSGTLAFFGNNAERMRMDVSGNIGIGTTNPTATLHLRSPGTTIRLEDTNNDDFLIHHNSDTLYFMRDNNDDGTWDDGDDDRVVFQGKANGVMVGIGTSAPASALHVVGTIRASSYCDLNGANCNATPGGTLLPVNGTEDIYGGWVLQGIGYQSAGMPGGTTDNCPGADNNNPYACAVNTSNNCTDRYRVTYACGKDNQNTCYTYYNRAVDCKLFMVVGTITG